MFWRSAIVLAPYSSIWLLEHFGEKEESMPTLRICIGLTLKQLFSSCTVNIEELRLKWMQILWYATFILWFCFSFGSYMFNIQLINLTKENNSLSTEGDLWSDDFNSCFFSPSFWYLPVYTVLEYLSEHCWREKKLQLWCISGLCWHCLANHS